MITSQPIINNMPMGVAQPQVTEPPLAQPTVAPPTSTSQATGSGGIITAMNNLSAVLKQLIEINQKLVSTNTANAEATKQAYKENSGSKGWGDTPYDPKNHIACIPPEIIGDLNKKKIMKGYQVIDMPALKRWLNDPENRVFRTRGGIV